MSAQPQYDLGVGIGSQGHPSVMWREVLAAHRASQLEVATRAGISKKHVNQIMQGQVLPSAATVVKMAAVLDEMRPPSVRDGGRRLARLMWTVQSHYVLDEALTTAREG